MKYFLKLSCPFLLLFLAVPTLAKSWKNIFPLQTSRAEVLNLLGSPKISLKDKSEYFIVGDQKVTFRWTRADCSGEDAITDEKLVKPNSLVYQITVVPDVALRSIDFYNSDEPKGATTVSGFLLSSYMTNCISNSSGQFSCSSVNSVYGFGYSNSNRGFTALYFVPTEEENKIWNGKHKPCSVVEDGK